MLPLCAAALLTISVPILLAGCPGETADHRSTERATVDRIPAVGAARLTSLVTGLEHPWGLAFLPGDEGLLITERPGRLRLVRNGRLEPAAIAGLPEIHGVGEGGLLDVALHPEFAENRLVYISYSKPGEGGATTALASGRLEGGRLTSVRDLFVADAWGTATVNYGGRIVFDREGFLFLTVGDRRQELRAQNVTDHVGTTVRLHEDGRVPDDNPFVDRPDARPEIYSYGHRNPQGMTMHPPTGAILQTDSGPAGGDEINIIQAGANYGWPLVSFGNHYDGRPIPDPRPGDGTARPIHYWNPSISPSGMMIYEGEAFPEWRGNLFVGSLAARHLNRLDLDGSLLRAEERLAGESGLRIRAVLEGPDGLVYLLTDAGDGALMRLEPDSPGSPPSR